MRFVARAVVVSTLVIVAAVIGSATVTHAAAPIRPNQHFIGLVNGSALRAVVLTVCPGPAGGDRTGPVAGGQTLSVARVGRGFGFTGPFGQVHAWFVQDVSGPRPAMVTFSVYRFGQAIPSSVRVPCDGEGQVQFSPCPYLAPCAYGWVPYVVTVRFVNVAA